MALTTSTITGRVPLPDDANPAAAEIVFTLSGYDTEGNQVIPGGARARFVLDDGDMPAGAKLWRNTEGLRGTVYAVEVAWSEAGRRETLRRTASLGVVQVGDDASYTLGELLDATPVPVPDNTYWRSITQQDYDDMMQAKADAEAAVAEAEAAAAQAALYEGFWLDDVAAVLADTSLTYTGGSPSSVVAGNYVRTRAEGFAYQVAASGATDHHVTTAGGVKLYLLTSTKAEPDKLSVNIIAHRGFLAVNMQDTMMAFSDATRWTKHLECDVSISADGTPYVFHDATVDALTSGTGTFTALSDATINGLTFDDLAGTDLVDMVGIPTFADFLTFASRRGAFIWPELKSLRANSDVSIVCQAVLDAQMERRCVLQSFTFVQVQLALDYDTRISAGFLVSGVTESAAQGHIDTLAQWAGRSWLCADFATWVTYPGLVRYAEARGVGVATWTVPDQTTANQLVSIGVRNMMTDHPLNKGVM